MLNFYNINNLEINSIVRVPSGAEENNKIYHQGYLYCYELFFCLVGNETVVFQNKRFKQKNDKEARLSRLNFSSLAARVICMDFKVFAAPE